MSAKQAKVNKYGYNLMHEFKDNKLRKLRNTTSFIFFLRIFFRFAFMKPAIPYQSQKLLRGGFKQVLDAL